MRAHLHVLSCHTQDFSMRTYTCSAVTWLPVGAHPIFWEPCTAVFLMQQGFRNPLIKKKTKKTSIPVVDFSHEKQIFQQIVSFNTSSNLLS